MHRIGILKPKAHSHKAFMAPFFEVNSSFGAQLSTEAALTILAKSNAPITCSLGTMGFSFIALLPTVILYLLV